MSRNHLATYVRVLDSCLGKLFAQSVLFPRVIWVTNQAAAILDMKDKCNIKDGACSFARMDYGV